MIYLSPFLLITHNHFIRDRSRRSTPDFLDCRPFIITSLQGASTTTTAKFTNQPFPSTTETSTSRCFLFDR